MSDLPEGAPGTPAAPSASRAPASPAASSLAVAVLDLLPQHPSSPHAGRLQQSAHVSQAEAPTDAQESQHDEGEAGEYIDAAGMGGGTEPAPKPALNATVDTAAATLTPFWQHQLLGRRPSPSLLARLSGMLGRLLSAAATSGSSIAELAAAGSSTLSSTGSWDSLYSARSGSARGSAELHRLSPDLLSQAGSEGEGAG